MRAIGLLVSLVLGAGQALAAAALPPPTSGEYCVTVQQVLASTTMTGRITVFTDMPEYRHSKPFVNPLRIYQVVTYAGQLPIVVSCKVKTAAHLRAAYGEKTAGKQYYCPEIARRSRDQAVAELRQAGNAAAADRAATFVVDQNEPYTTGQSYLSDFQSIYRAADGQVHIGSPGLFQDYDSWITMLLPEQVQGQSYCHLATVDYIKAVATGAMQPGATITTGDDAVVTPQ
jgi:hypothetical protein